MKHFIMLLLLCSFAFAFTCKVLHVSDGDTITVLTQEQKRLKFRLNGIDAPEKNQPYGQISKAHLSELVLDKDINATIHGTDKYGRKIATLYINDTDINAQQVKEGLAWAYVKYSTKYTTLENEAKEQQKGLWKEDHPIAPWEWRKR